MSRLLLLDTASLYFRAYFGVPDSLRSPDGTPVNAVRGLLDFIARLVDTYRPTQLACCWDNSWRPRWRVELIESYKAQRVQGQDSSGAWIEEVPEDLRTQVPIIREVLAAIGIPVVGVDEYEADDVIGSLAAQANLPVDVVTGDRDLFQLIDDDAPGGPLRVLYTARGVATHQVFTAAEVREKYEIEPGQYADFAILRGDPSDGLPGVAGVGEKTAARLLAQYGDLSGIQAAAADPESSLRPAVRTKVQEAGEYLAAAQQVVAVARDLPVTGHDLRVPGTEGLPVPADRSALEELSATWGLGASPGRVLTALGAHGA